MESALRYPHSLLMALAFFRRAFLHLSTGRTLTIGEHRERRATVWLAFFAEPKKGIRWQIVLEDLKLQPDLLTEDASINPSCLELQLQVLKHAKDWPRLAEIRDKWLVNSQSPVKQLFQAVLQRAVSVQAPEVVFAFSEDSAAEFRNGHSVVEEDIAFNVARVLQESGGSSIFMKVGASWSEAMRLPQNLFQGLQGTCLQVEAARDVNLISVLYVRNWSPLEEIQFNWESPDLLRILFQS